MVALRLRHRPGQNATRGGRRGDYTFLGAGHRMRKWVLFCMVAGMSTASAAPDGAAQYRAVLDQYCVSCHNDRVKTGGLSLQTVDLAQAPANADVLEKVIRRSEEHTSELQS